jgi:hypothetical protein
MFTLTTKKAAEISASAELSAKGPGLSTRRKKLGERLSDKRASGCPAWVNPVKDRLASEVDAENSSSSIREEP